MTLFFEALIFNYINAGTDAHAKNYAILEPVNGTLQLAPLYDIASLFAYDTQHKAHVSCNGSLMPSNGQWHP